MEVIALFPLAFLPDLLSYNCRKSKFFLQDIFHDLDLAQEVFQSVLIYQKYANVHSWTAYEGVQHDPAIFHYQYRSHQDLHLILRLLSRPQNLEFGVTDHCY